MRIKEIIVESSTQLDEGVLDTVKSKLTSVYQMARKQYPNFDKVFTVAKSHQAELSAIAQELNNKKESGKLSKEDVMMAIQPLAKKVSNEVGIDNQRINEGFSDLKNPVLQLIPLVPSLMGLLFSTKAGVTIYLSLMAILVAVTALDEYIDRPGGPAEKQREENFVKSENEKKYYASLVYKLRDHQRLTAQEMDDWHRLFEKYGLKSGSRLNHHYMTNVDIERYSKEYRPGS